MNVVEYNNILDRLTLQIKSFQESFSFLSGAGSIEELGANFHRVLRGNFFLGDVNIFFKKNESSDWKPIRIHNDNCVHCLPLLKITSNVFVEYHDENEFKVIATLPLIDGAYFGLLIGEKINKSEITELDKITLQMFMQLLDNAYQSLLNQKKEKQLIFSLNHRVVQLNSLIDTGIEISRLQESSSLFELTIERAVALTNASYGVLQVLSDSKEILTIGYPDNNTEQVFNSKNKISASVSYQGIEYSLTLADKESRNGISDFDETDKILLTAFARQVLAALENEHWHREALDKERMHKEIEMAAIIQRKIIPQKLPVINGYDLAGINIPSLEIGGDYYDVAKLKDGRFLLIIADVSGKGVPSGLLVNSLNASLSAYLENDFELTDVATRLNKVIFKASPPEKYITAFVAILDPAAASIEYINAGHNPILFLHNDQLQKLDKGGLAFGMLDMNLPFESGQIKIETGDRILFYTDGIPEAMDANEEEYSDQKLEEFFIRNKPNKADIFIKNLVADVKKHTTDTPQSDDITALYLIRNS